MASDRLKEVRKNFVERASKNVILQLLDDLLEARVLNDGEVESVREENSKRADMARVVIDMVRMKGNQASEVFIARLGERDISLSQTLGLNG